MPYIRVRDSRRTLRRERPWILLGGSGLAAVAGFINVCVLTLSVIPVSHVTGAVSHLSIDLEVGISPEVLIVAGVIGAFMLGAAVSGAIIGDTHLRPGRRYGAALVIEGILLAAATHMLLGGSSYGIVAAAMACGIQNAMASSYYGLVVRTTHVTGIVTDIGVMIGHWLRYRRVSIWKLGLLFALLFSFFGGGFAAAMVVRTMGVAALALPAVGCLVTGAVYYAWRHRQEVSRVAPTAA